MWAWTWNKNDIWNVCSSQQDNFQIYECGLFVNPKHPALGASPDEIISCDCCEIGTLEIKCPYCSRDFTPETTTEYEMLTFLESDDHAYYYQVQVQLHICAVTLLYGRHKEFTLSVFCHKIIFFSLKVETSYIAWIIRQMIYKDTNCATCLQVLKQVTLPTLTCGDTVSNLKMTVSLLVCLIQWLYLDFLKLNTSKVPKGDWYCLNCPTKFSGRCSCSTKM